MTNPVMVTGGLGAIGAYVCRRMLAGGFTPLIVDPGSANGLLGSAAGSCLLAPVSVTDVPSLLAVIKEHRPASIVHLAGMVGPPVERHPWEAVGVNLMGVASLLESARLAGIERFVYLSSRLVYGPVADPHLAPEFAPVNERHPREPMTLYGKLKRAAEDLIQHYAENFGLDATALRFASVIGPGKLPRASNVSPVNELIEAAAENRQPAPLRSTGERDQYAYMGEYAHGVECALAQATVPGRFRAYNLASDIFADLAELVRELKLAYPHWAGPRLELEPGFSYRGVGYSFRLDTGLARRELGFVPEYDIQTTIADYARVLGLITRERARLQREGQRT